jgi:acyl-CoA synthetase (AMP-forming)/AMP-acid ligase II
MSSGRRLRPTYQHPRTSRWAAAGGAWTDETLDGLLGEGESDGRVAVVAGGLRAAGVGPGDVVAWQRPNDPDAVALYRAAWRLGAIAAPIHHRSGSADVRALLDRLAPTVFVGPDQRVPTGRAVRTGTVDVDPAGVAVALATAGSTGPSKLVLHSHRALAYKARVMATAHGLGPDDGMLLSPPLAHVSGLLNGVLLTGCGLRAVPMAAWDPVDARRLIGRERITFMVGPPTFFVSLMADPGFDPARVRPLRLVSCGGAGVTAAFVRSASAALGCRVKRSYGSTEAPTVTTSTADDDGARDADTDGRAVGHAEVRVVDPGSRDDVAPEVVGEVWVRGPELFVGYDDPAATETAFADGGWFRTGDLGRLDADGWLTIVGRLRDVIIRGGENIAASEVEAVLEAHPAVRHAVVVGGPDPRLGERVCAFVEADPRFDLAACRSWFAQQGITRFKWPERIEVVARLPLLPAGKPDRAALRARL